MTTVLPGHPEAGTPPGHEAGAAGPGEDFFLDDATKEVLRKVLDPFSGRSGRSARPVDWDTIWSLAERRGLEELALGAALLAAGEALSAQPVQPAPSTILLGRAPAGSLSPTLSPQPATAPSVLLLDVAGVAPGPSVWEPDGSSPLRPFGAGGERLGREERETTWWAGDGEEGNAPSGGGPVTEEAQAARPVARGLVGASAAVGAAGVARGVLRAITVATWVRNVGIVIVLFAVWQLWGTGISESHAQSQLKAQYEALVRGAGRTAELPGLGAPGGAANHASHGHGPAVSGAEPPPGTHKLVAGGPKAVASTTASDATAAARVSLAAETKAFSEAALPGGVLGQIRIPAIAVDDYFVDGVGESQLQQGPGRYPGSGLPGQVGNLAIAGHRTTYGAPFFRLGHLKVGDRVIIDVPEGRAVYTVSQPPFAVSPYDVDVLADFGDARLTLTTCNPPFFATTRLIVVAKLAWWLPTGARAATRPQVSASKRADQTGRTSASGPRLRPTGPARAPSRPATSVPVRPKAPGGPGRVVASPPAASTAVTEGSIGDASTVEQSLSAEGGGWHLAMLPVVLAVVAALSALGLLYRRVEKFFKGRSRWLIMAPMWLGGLLILFKVLGLLLPADL